MKLGLATVEEQQVTGWRNDTDIVRIVGREWLAWLRLTWKVLPCPEPERADRTIPFSGGGFKSMTTTHTQVLDLGESRKTEPSKSCWGQRTTFTEATAVETARVVARIELCADGL